MVFYADQHKNPRYPSENNKGSLFLERYGKKCSYMNRNVIRLLLQHIGFSADQDKHCYVATDSTKEYATTK